MAVSSSAVAAAPASAKHAVAKAKTVSHAEAKTRYRKVLVVRSSRPAGSSSRHAGIHHDAAPVRFVPERPSFGQIYGLHNASDSLELKSSVALVLDQDTDEVLFSKNSQAVLPIASLTKLMTAVVVTEANLPLDEPITITDDDIDTEKFSRSRLKVGTQLRREEMLHLALMSSENRAAHALGRTYPGGLYVFVAAMNRKARELGMNDTHYVEPTGLSSLNQSSARDLATLVKTAHEYRIIRELSTSHEYQVEVGNRQIEFHNTNGLVKNPSWDISLQKTGYISEAGRCLVMQAKMAGRQLIMVFLDSAGKYSRIGDAERVRRWVTESAAALPVLGAVKPKI
ncbi:MAG: D-alanyl-D-alanine endopeptidase [Pseudomonadota bacterium]|nr:D-alanyl-D-alanine endopeptidase [Pseudomonadota bacterium]